MQKIFSSAQVLKIAGETSILSKEDGNAREIKLAYIFATFISHMKLSIFQ